MSLYHNLGNGKFEDVTKQAGLDPAIHGVSCTAGDYDNDGFVDLAVTTRIRVLLFTTKKTATSMHKQVDMRNRFRDIYRPEAASDGKSDMPWACALSSITTMMAILIFMS